MKKSIFILLACIAIMSSCEKEDINPLIGTKWTRPAALAHIIWGGICTTSVEFLTETTCQKIDAFDTYTYIEQGVYKHWADSVSWTIETTTIKGKISGSVILSDDYDLGSNRIYTKE